MIRSHSPRARTARGWLCASLLGVLLGCAGEDAPGGPEARGAGDGPLNVLFLAVDDLGCRLGCYGLEDAHTPNIDSLAATGLCFDRAYCSSAICNPSRAAMLTGCRPETNGVEDLRTDYRGALPDHVVLPQLFREAGWTTFALGKVHHGDGSLDDERAWSLPCWRPARWQRYYASPEAQALVKRRTREEVDQPDYPARVLAWEAPEVADEELPDGLIADAAIGFLRQRGDEPFFLAVGFLKPHLPFVAPKRYWDLHPEDSVELATRRTYPVGAPPFAVHDSPELRAYENVPAEGPIDDAMQRTLIRGYQACVSFVDAQIGRVLAALEEEGLADRTIVVLWGDHGWHLGDLSMWGKHSSYESAVRTPLLISVPGMEHRGERCAALVESVDLYPTLAELCGLDAPEQLEGESLVPLLADPRRPWKEAVFGISRRNVEGLGFVRGHSMRTSTHRVVEWLGPKRRVRGIEIYDYTGEAVEVENLAQGEENRALATALLERLRAGWRTALPPEPAGDGAEED